MVILCSFIQNGIEGLSNWRVAASGLNRQSWFGDLQLPNVLSSLLNQQLPQYKGEKYD
jgi:hypothetical protein